MFARTSTAEGTPSIVIVYTKIKGMEALPRAPSSFDSFPSRITSTLKCAINMMSAGCMTSFRLPPYGQNAKIPLNVSPSMHLSSI